MIINHMTETRIAIESDANLLIIIIGTIIEIMPTAINADSDLV